MTAQPLTGSCVVGGVDGIRRSHASSLDPLGAVSPHAMPFSCKGGAGARRGRRTMSSKNFSKTTSEVRHHQTADDRIEVSTGSHETPSTRTSLYRRDQWIAFMMKYAHDGHAATGRRHHGQPV